MSEELDIQVEDVPQEQDFLNMSDEEFANANIENTQKDVQEDTSETQEDESTEESIEEKNTETEEIDYKAEYERITAPFKANGKEVQVKSIDDAIQLMQMGADYQRKTTEIKPLRKIGEMLKQNDLLDAEKLSYLIDLKNKNPVAIQKLLKESGIDPLDIDTSKEVEYKPTNYQVDEKVIELNDVLDSLQHTEQFTRTVDILGNQWDQQSKEYLSANPQTIAILNEHIGNGIYDTIAKEIANQRMLGRLNGVSDLDAYRTVGDYIQANGGFNITKQEPVTQQPVQPTKPIQDNKSKKQAASITRTAPSKKTTDLSTLDIMAMSDEEFAKLDKSLFR
jgi:hypothetical protein